MLGMACAHGVPLVYIDKMTYEELAPLRALEPDLLIVGGYSIILKEPLLTLPRLGCLNTHSSLLPKHRGPNPFTAVILADDAETGVTFHKMDPGIDTGDIVEQVRMPVAKNATGGSLYRETSQLAGKHILEVVDRIEVNGLAGTPQDPAEATYDKKLDLKEARIRWERPAVEIDRLVRACSPFYIARLLFRGHTVYVYKTTFDETPVDAAPGTVIANAPRVKVATGQGSVVLKSTLAVWPLPMPWPSYMSRPRAGEVLE
jgi:methionyl-tRNA formyltransferase